MKWWQRGIVQVLSDVSSPHIFLPFLENVFVLTFQSGQDNGHNQPLSRICGLIKIRFFFI